MSATVLLLSVKAHLCMWTHSICRAGYEIIKMLSTHCTDVISLAYQTMLTPQQVFIKITVLHQAFVNTSLPAIQINADSREMLVGDDLDGDQLSVCCLAALEMSHHQTSITPGKHVHLTGPVNPAHVYFPTGVGQIRHDGY